MLTHLFSHTCAEMILVVKEDSEQLQSASEQQKGYAYIGGDRGRKQWWFDGGKAEAEIWQRFC